MTSRMWFELLWFLLSTNTKVKKMTSVSRYVWNRWNVYISNSFALFFCMLYVQNRDLFYFWVCSKNTLLWKDFSCFRRLILSLSWKSNDRDGLKFWICLHATVLLAVKYWADLNKFIYPVREGYLRKIPFFYASATKSRGAY